MSGEGPKTTDVYGPEKRSAVMRRVKGRDTTPELIVRASSRNDRPPAS